MLYLDNAATTFPKPPEVAREVFRCITGYCGNPGRGGHSLSLAAAKKVYDFSETMYSDKRIFILFRNEGVPTAVIFEGTAKIAKMVASFCNGAEALKGEVLHG